MSSKVIDLGVNRKRVCNFLVLPTPPLFDDPTRGTCL